MQIYADFVNWPLFTIGSDQGPALGSAIHAAIAPGAYPDVVAAAQAMGRVNRGVCRPITANLAAYDDIFAECRGFTTTSAAADIRRCAG